MFFRSILNFLNKLLIILIFITLINTILLANEELKVIKVFPPKCTVLKDNNILLCPRIMEIELEFDNTEKQLVSCILLSEEEEILAYGENYITPPGGKMYLTIRQMRRKIHEMKLIASAKCTLK